METLLSWSLDERHWHLCKIPGAESIFPQGSTGHCYTLSGKLSSNHSWQAPALRAVGTWCRRKAQQYLFLQHGCVHWWPHIRHEVPARQGAGFHSRVLSTWTNAESSGVWNMETLERTEEQAHYVSRGASLLRNPDLVFSHKWPRWGHGVTVVLLPLKGPNVTLALMLTLTLRTMLVPLSRRCCRAGSALLRAAAASCSLFTVATSTCHCWSQILQK